MNDDNLCVTIQDCIDYLTEEVRQIDIMLGGILSEDYEKYIQSSKKWLNNWDENLVSSDGYKGFIHKRAADGSYATVDPSHFLGYDGTEMKWQGYGDDF